jgi:hypothetical protein
VQGMPEVNAIDAVRRQGYCVQDGSHAMAKRLCQRRYEPPTNARGQERVCWGEGVGGRCMGGCGRWGVSRIDVGSRREGRCRIQCSRGVGRQGGWGTRDETPWGRVARARGQEQNTGNAAGRGR